MTKIPTSKSTFYPILSSDNLRSKAKKEGSGTGEGGPRPGRGVQGGESRGEATDAPEEAGHYQRGGAGAADAGSTR